MKSCIPDFPIAKRGVISRSESAILRTNEKPTAVPVGSRTLSTDDYTLRGQVRPEPARVSKTGADFGEIGPAKSML
jgi:hypothetical protein